MAGDGRPQTRRQRFRYIAGAICLAVLVWLAQWIYQEVRSTEIRAYAPEHSTPSSVAGSDWAGRFTFAGEPKTEGYPNDLTRLENLAYLVGYDEEHKNPAWVAYRIPAKKLKGQFPRPTTFRTDGRTQAKVSPDDYTNSGFDRGHMAPNSAVARGFGKAAQAETFLMSNIAPQLPELNRGLWRELEEVLANDTAAKAEEVWVVIGPIYAEGSADRMVGGPLVPYAFFAVVADETETGPRVQAFIISQTPLKGEDLRECLVSVDEVERKTGLNFFWEITDEVEVRLERTVPRYWLE